MSTFTLLPEQASYNSLATLPKSAIIFAVTIMTFIAGCASDPAMQKTDVSPTTESYVAFTDTAGSFPLVDSSATAPLYVSGADHAGVMRAARDLQSDIELVTGQRPRLGSDSPDSELAVIIGTLGHSPLIDDIVEAGKVDVSDLAGRWESALVQVVADPLPGVERALVIAGSDKRGTIYGIYDLAERIGVSPWHYWADVPVARHGALYIRPGRHHLGEPAVKYRGIFLNDENPALLGWAGETFGGFNHQFYEKVFELILRLKGNYLWPAMWGKAFNDDDPVNPELADEYGIVMGTSHHEPLMRAHVEWERHGEGEWNYETNAGNLREFWRKGIERMGEHESLVTIGMRGDGDLPMTEGTAIDLLETIVADQRDIIEDVTGNPAAETPQVWALYKEVQDYYDTGMEVPDDVTLLFADDNWGNIRRLPRPDADRPGGYGVYYHFDYVGGPRSYRWINTNQIERTWEQMRLAWRHGATRLWIVNVGDLKPMELPTDFFLTYAFDPQAWTAERLPEFYREWATQQFGGRHADAIARILTEYTRFNSRRKPELLSPETWSLAHYNEAERIVGDYRALERKARTIYDTIPVRHRDAYYQLVLSPVAMSANVNALYYAVARNHLYADQGRAATNEMADRAEALFAKDAELTDAFHHELADGKWNHMMSQPHIGYTSWDNPPRNVMPETARIELDEAPAMGVAIEGTATAWPNDSRKAQLPDIDKYQRQLRRIEVFNRGREAFRFEAHPRAEWLEVTPGSGHIDKQTALQVTVDWTAMPPGTHDTHIDIRGSEGTTVTVDARVVNPETPPAHQASGYVESNGAIAIEGVDFHASSGQWERIPNLGRTRDAMTSLPVIGEPSEPGGNSAHLAYRIHLFEPGEITIRAYLSPTLDFRDSGGLRYAVSIDDAPPTIVNMHADDSHPAWQQWVSNNINITESRHTIDSAGEHVVRFWRVDPGVVLQRLVIDTGGLEPSYLGPVASEFPPDADPESAWATGEHRNLFVEYGIATPAEVDARIKEAYQQLFFGDPQDERVLYPADEDMAFIYANDSNDIRSEGMSYGMIIALMMDDQETFDRLWRFASEHMQVKSGDQAGYFAWHLENEPPYDPISINPAPDGEEYFVMALLFADKRWGSRDGIFDYRTEANRILDVMLNKDTASISPMFHPIHDQIVFSPAQRDQYTDPSYHLPAFYELWARWADGDSDYYDQLADVSRDFLGRASAPETGLFPEYASFDGRPRRTAFNPLSHRSGPDAHRVIQNMAIDYAWFSRDDELKALIEKLLTFYESRSLTHETRGYVGAYELDGEPLTDSRPSSLVAMNAVAALAVDESLGRGFVEDLWTQPTPRGYWRYYSGLLHMLGLLHVSGQFRIYGNPVLAP